MFRFALLLLLLKFHFIICNQTKNQIATIDIPPKGFGKYIINIRYIEKCSDSGVTNDPVNNNDVKFWTSKLNEIDEGVNGYVVVNNYYEITKGKFTPFILRDGVMVPTFNQTSTSPCNDFILSFPLKSFFSPDEKCGLKKGNYSIVDLNANKYTHMIAGENFIYVRSQVVIEYFSDVGRTFCIVVTLDINPVPKITKKNKPIGH